MPPKRKQANHDSQRRYLAYFNPQVKTQNTQQNTDVVISQRQLLQSRRQAKAMQQPKSEHSPQQIWRLHIKILLKSTIVVKAFVNYADGDDGVDQIVVPSDFEKSSKNQSDAVSDGEHGDEFCNCFERGKKKHHAKKKQQMVVTRKHMAGPQANVPDVAARQHAQTVGLRNAVRQNQQGETAGK
jgi:hypothetical protein